MKPSHAHTTAPSNDPYPVAPTPAPTDINQVPVPLRANIVALARKGMPHAELAARFDLPVGWIVLLVECPPGSTEH